MVCCSGGGFSVAKSQSAMKKLIEEHGGKVSSSCTKATDYVIVKNASSNLCSDKCGKARKRMSARLWCRG